MKIIRINADEALWRNSMLPEGILERWLVADGGHHPQRPCYAQIRIEGALHDGSAGQRPPRHFAT